PAARLVTTEPTTLVTLAGLAAELSMGGKCRFRTAHSEEKERTGAILKVTVAVSPVTTIPSPTVPSPEIALCAGAGLLAVVTSLTPPSAITRLAETAALST